MVTIDENTVGVWFIILDDITDFMCALQQVGSNYKLTARFCYSDSNPTKNWFTADLKSGTTKEEALRFAREQIAKFEKMSGNSGCEILVHDKNLKAFHDELRKYTNRIEVGRA